MKRMMLIAGALALAMFAGGCTTAASGLASLATSMSSSTPQQVQTYAKATEVADLATRTVDLAVNNVKFSKATLIELQALNDSLHDAWLKLKTAKDAGQSLSFASFNAALAAYQTYRTEEAIPEAPSPATS
jgi:PBP1b-binding outer membrane lipoprotein LpoB